MTVSVQNKGVKILFILFILFIHRDCFSQPLIIEDSLLKENHFQSINDFTSNFLLAIFNDSVDYKKFYSAKLVKLIIQEEDRVKGGGVNPNDIIFNQEELNKLFYKLCKKNVSEFYLAVNDSNINSVKVESINLKRIKLNDVIIGRFKLDAFEMIAEFINLKNNISYKIIIYEIYQVNNRWILMEPQIYLKKR